MTATVPSFIVGCGRSGTTLLRAMLDSHPELAVPPESYFTVSLLKQRQNFERSDLGPGSGLDHRVFLDELTTTRSFGEWGLSRERLEGYDPLTEATDVPSAIAAVYSCYAEEHGKTRPVDKTPFQGPNIGLLAAAFPGARFVHLIRDGRNVAQSLATMSFGPDTLDGAIQEWRLQINAIDRHHDANPDDVLAVRYEDLVDDPPTILASICDHLGLSFDPAMLTYPERAGEVLAGMAETAHLEGVRQAPTRDRRDWRSTLSDDDLMVLEGLAGDALARHGYELVGRPPSTTGRLRILRSQILYRLRAARLGVGARRARRRRRQRIKAETNDTGSPAARTRETGNTATDSAAADSATADTTATSAGEAR